MTGGWMLAAGWFCGFLLKRVKFVPVLIPYTLDRLIECMSGD